MRDLKKEAEWRKNKYKRFVVDVDKEFGEQFQKKLDSAEIKYSDWVKNEMEKFMKKYF